MWKELTMSRSLRVFLMATSVMTVLRADVARAAGPCDDLPSQSALRAALSAAQSESNGGFGLTMWATLVNRDGIVCAVAFTGVSRGDQWPGSRVISAQKANTANAFSLPGLALSTANLYSAVQGGGSLFGLQHSNPVNTDVAYGGSPSAYGTASDPMVGGRIGGVNVFGGGHAQRPDNIVYDITPQAGQMEGVSAGGWGHPVCSAAAKTIAGGLPAVK